MRKSDRDDSQRNKSNEAQVSSYAVNIDSKTQTHNFAACKTISE